MNTDPREFNPALVRLQQTPPAPLGRSILWATLAFFAALLGWATVGRLDIVAVAEGKLVPETYVKIVQPVDGGVVKEILVKEGEAVKAGQTLMRMDTTLSQSDLKALAADYQNKRIALRRIDAQLNGGAFTRRADEPAELFAQVLAQYHANRRAYENASLGTDHGRGGAMFLLGGGVRGGRIITDWPGLTEDRLEPPGDLAVTIDYREILAEIVRDKLANPRWSEVFPGVEVRGRALFG
jgi:hypothetical protein